jgi:hypothetical protein
MARDPKPNNRTKLWGNKRLKPNEARPDRKRTHSFWDYHQCEHRLASGKQCTWASVPGGTLCFHHVNGSTLGRVMAQNRLIALVQPALTTLEELMMSGDDQTRYKAATAILDRVPGFNARGTITLEKTDPEELHELSEEQLRERAALALKRLSQRDDADPPGVRDGIRALPAPEVRDEPIEGEVLEKPEKKDSIH